MFVNVGVCGCKCVWVCARARVVHDYMSVIPRAKPIRQQSKPSKRFNFLAKTLTEDLALALYKICQDLGLLGKILSSQQDRGFMGKILASWARSWPHGQDLEHLAQVSWPFLSARGKPFCVSYLEVSHCVSASQR